MRKPACIWRSVVFRKVEFVGNFVFFNIKTKHTRALFCFLADLGRWDPRAPAAHRPPFRILSELLDALCAP